MFLGQILRQDIRRHLPLQYTVSPYNLPLINFLFLRQLGKDMEMVGHNAPTQHPNPAELGNTKHHGQEVLTFLVLQKINAMGNAADQMMNRIALLDPVI